MTHRFRYATVVLVGLLVLGCTAAVGQVATGSFEQSLSIDTPVELEVEAGAGDVSVRRGSGSRVRIVGRIEVRGGFGRSDDEAAEVVRELETDPPVEVSGSRVRVGHGLEGRELYERGVRISYEIEVPERTSVTSRTGSGSQQLSGIAGPVNASAGSGTLRVTDIGNGVELGRGSGDIRAERIAGPITARAGSGSITVSQTASGDVEVRTGSGDSDLSGIDGALHARAGSGDVTVQGRPRGGWNVATGSGGVRVALPAALGFELDARTGSGEIYSEQPITLEGRVDRQHVRADVRGGGTLIQLRTGSGDIRIEEHVESGAIQGDAL